MKDNNFKLSDMYAYAGSKDGCAIYKVKKNGYIVLYNDLCSIKRQRWTLAHELGHIVLNHLKDNKLTKICRNNITDEEYIFMEKEANEFAAQFLANSNILSCLDIKNPGDITTWCNLSNEASKNRFNNLKKSFLKNNSNFYTDAILKYFYDFINRKICVNCGFKHHNKDIDFCPICGEIKFERRCKSMIYNDGYELNENSKAVKCPKCENEVIPKGDYCNICGTFLINRCNNEAYDIYGNLYQVDCNQLASGNSRFCTKCGSRTTFYDQGFLKPYDYDQDKHIYDGIPF